MFMRAIERAGEVVNVRAGVAARGAARRKERSDDEEKADMMHLGQ